MSQLTVDSWYRDRVLTAQYDFAAANITAITTIRPRPPLLIAVLLQIRQLLK